MSIEQLSSRTGNKFVTVSLVYEECRDIANGLYHISKEKPEYEAIYNKCKIMFDLVKEGMIAPGTISRISKEEKQNEHDK